MKKRIVVYQKYNGLCAYSGKPLDSDWQIDHMVSKMKHEYNSRILCPDVETLKERMKQVNHIDNLMPVLKIVNHYKRGFDLDGFRTYMNNFHVRLSKLPKNPKSAKGIKRKQYLYIIADIFDIKTDKPFSGVFYFETLQNVK